MIEPVTVPILLDVEESSESYLLEVDTPVIINKIEGGPGVPPGGATGDLLAKASDEDYATEWITPASSAERDNTRPITAAAVYTEIGNINALLASI